MKQHTPSDSRQPATHSHRSLRWAIWLAVAAWVALPFVCWSAWGIDELEDWFIKNALPVGLLWNVLWLTALVCGWKGRFRLAVAAVLLAVAVGLVGNPTLSQAVMARHESKYPNLGPHDLAEPLDAIVVLGGCSRRLPGGRVEVTSDGQRIVAVAEFWHAQKTGWIITTGEPSTGGDDQEFGHDQELTKNADLLASLGVPAAQILYLPARNTHDEMAAIGQLFAERPDDFRDGRIGLVTSAYHLPRAMRLAKARGLDLVPLPSGHRAVLGPWKPSDLVPDAYAVGDNSLLIREWLAMLVGR